MNMQGIFNKLTKHIDLTQLEMEDIMRALMQGELSDAQIAALLMGLRMKGESIGEITAAAKIMREFSRKVDVSDLPHVVDIVGTGGDGQNLFNVSTASVFVMAAAGANVAKHGNRGVSTKSGSSDLLEQAGICLDLNVQQTEQCLREIGIGFLFAPNHHPAMKYVVNVRRELGVRTIFNLLGPLTNPADAKRLMIGVFSKELCRPMAEVLHNLGAEHVMVVHSQDGLDEISLAHTTFVAELKHGEIHEWQIQPEDVKIASQSLHGLYVENAEQSLALIENALGLNKSEQGQKAAQMIALNAGAGLYVAGLVSNYQQGVYLASDLIQNGQALEKMRELSKFSHHIKQQPI